MSHGHLALRSGVFTELAADLRSSVRFAIVVVVDGCECCADIAVIFRDLVRERWRRPVVVELYGCCSCARYLATLEVDGDCYTVNNSEVLFIVEHISRMSSNF